jgi:hypothetical protein
MHSTPKISVNRTNGNDLPLNYDLLATVLGGGIIQGGLLSRGPNALAEQKFSVGRDQGRDDRGFRSAFAATIARFVGALTHRQSTRPLAATAGVRPC